MLFTHFVTQLVLATEQEYIIWTSHAKREDKVQTNIHMMQHRTLYSAYFSPICSCMWKLSRFLVPYATTLPFSSSVWSTEVTKPNHMLFGAYWTVFFSLMWACVELSPKGINSRQREGGRFGNTTRKELEDITFNAFVANVSTKSVLLCRRPSHQGPDVMFKSSHLTVSNGCSF